MAVDLYPHNQTAYEAAASMMREQGKAAVIHPTGTGKSFIGFKLAEDNPQVRICWLAPSEYIFTTQRENYLKAGGQEDAIAKITFLTYARLMRNEELITELLPEAPEYIVLDEFHRCGAAEWGKGVRKLLDTFPSAKILGLSATNVRYLDNQRDMADELFEGRVASRMSLGEAIARGILPPPVYVTALYAYGEELKKLRKQVESLKNPVQQRKCESILKKLTRNLQNADGPDQIFGRHMKADGKYLVFCADKEHMDEMLELAEATGGWFHRIDTEPHIYQAYYDSSESREQFESFRKDESSHLKLLYCIDMLNEGIHVADVDGVVLLRPTISPILYLQQVGRALSSAQDRQPVIFDMVNNFDGLYSIDALKGEMEEAFCVLPESVRGSWQERFLIWDEVRECRQLFEQLQRNLSASWDTYYQELENYHRTHGNILLPKDYITESGLNLGSWLMTQRRVRQGMVSGSLTVERIAKLDRLGMRWDRINDTRWMEGYQHLLAFRDRYGHVDVPSSYKAEDGYSLGHWLTNQRCAYVGDRNITDERIRLLEEAGVKWNARNESWNRYYAAAKEFFQREGHLRVPKNYMSKDGLRLGNWISAQRCGADNLTPDKKAALEQIGMIWETFSDERWNTNFLLAQAYYREHGHLNVPKDYESGGVKLGRWVCRMREQAREGADRPLTEEQIASLDTIGMVWESSWDIRFLEAKEYYEKHGNLRIPQTYVTEKRIWLGKWIYEQRKKKDKSGRSGLTTEQVRKLESIGMVWN